MNAHWLRFAIFAAAVALLWPTPSRSGEPNWPDQLLIGTASPGGTYYVYGEGLAKILTRTLDLPVVRLATEGPAQNIELLEAGEAKLGFVTIGIALQAWNGTGVWAGKKPARSMRAIFPMYDTPFQFLVLQESGIRSIAEMAGKRVGVGPRGGGAPAPGGVPAHQRFRLVCSYPLRCREHASGCVGRAGTSNTGSRHQTRRIH